MFTLNCCGRLLVVDKPLVMGIINTTPDSFYAGSRVYGEAQLLKQAEQMLAEGAAILDIGGQSTRPGSVRISAEEELQRVMGAISAIHRRFPEVYISIDTYWSRVAQEAVAAGACMVNDISAGLFDGNMLATVARLNVPYVCMHMKGTPETMQDNPEYQNLVQEVLDFFIERTAQCRQAGIKDIIIDPGFGFGKTIPHNFELLRQLQLLQVLDCPILLGISRKSTVWKTLGITAAEALNGTTVLHTIGLLHGAHILRVHDVKEAVEAVKLVEAMKNAV
jgi:dihydropteroate synthase